MSVGIKRAVTTVGVVGIGGLRQGDDRLRLSAVAPGSIEAGRSKAMLDVRVTNVSGGRLRAITSIAASVVVVDHGVGVGEPLPIRDAAAFVDLAPGESRVFRSGADLHRCSTNVGLFAGTYALYATQQFTLIDADGGPGETLELQTGPWVLRLTRRLRGVLSRSFSGGRGSADEGRGGPGPRPGRRTRRGRDRASRSTGCPRRTAPAPG